jgi:hypothetical protein
MPKRDGWTYVAAIMLKCESISTVLENNAQSEFDLTNGDTPGISKPSPVPMFMVIDISIYNLNGLDWLRNAINSPLYFYGYTKGGRTEYVTN